MPDHMEKMHIKIGETAIDKVHIGNNTQSQSTIVNK